MDEYRVEMLHWRETGTAAASASKEERTTSLTEKQDEIADGVEGEMEDQSSGSNQNRCLNSEEEEEDSWSEPG